MSNQNYFGNSIHPREPGTPPLPVPGGPAQVPQQQPAPGISLPAERLNAVAPARQNAAAMAAGQLHGALGYTREAEAEYTLEGWTEPPEVVHSKARTKEEFPQG